MTARDRVRRLRRPHVVDDRRLLDHLHACVIAHRGGPNGIAVPVTALDVPAVCVGGNHKGGCAACSTWHTAATRALVAVVETDDGRADSGVGSPLGACPALAGTKPPHRSACDEWGG